MTFFTASFKLDLFTVLVNPLAACTPASSGLPPPDISAFRPANACANSADLAKLFIWLISAAGAPPALKASNPPIPPPLTNDPSDPSDPKDPSDGAVLSHSVALPSPNFVALFNNGPSCDATSVPLIAPTCLS